MDGEKEKHPFDLEERTLKFGGNIIQLSRSVNRTVENLVIRKQIVRSGTSVGANYCEANEAISHKDFVHRLRICRKECKETKYWLELFKFNNLECAEKADQLTGEAMELVKIFSRIIEKNL